MMACAEVQGTSEAGPRGTERRWAGPRGTERRWAGQRWAGMLAAPLAGAPPRNPRQAWLPSVHLLCHPGWPLPTWPGLTRLPRLVARGYLAAVPGRCCARTTFLRRNRQHEKPHRV